MRKQQIVLKQQADAPLAGRQMIDALACQFDLNFGVQAGQWQACNGCKQAAFAATAGAHQRGDAPWRAFECQIAQQHALPRRFTYAQCMHRNFHHGKCSGQGWDQALKRLGRPSQAARPKTSAGSSHCNQANAATKERCPPEDSVTASVVTVTIRPSPT